MGLKLTSKIIGFVDYDKVPMWAIAKIIYIGGNKGVLPSFMLGDNIVRKMESSEGFEMIVSLSGKEGVLIQDKKAMSDYFQDYRFMVLPEGTELQVDYQSVDGLI